MLRLFKKAGRQARKADKRESTFSYRNSVPCAPKQSFVDNAAQLFKTRRVNLIRQYTRSCP